MKIMNISNIGTMSIEKANGTKISIINNIITVTDANGNTLKQVSYKAGSTISKRNGKFYINNVSLDDIINDSYDDFIADVDNAVANDTVEINHDYTNYVENKQESKDNRVDNNKKNNNGTVMNNCDIIEKNNGTVMNNYGIIKNNYGTIMNNYGIVKNNYGTIMNSSGIVKNDYGTIMN